MHCKCCQSVVMTEKCKTVNTATSECEELNQLNFDNECRVKI